MISNLIGSHLPVQEAFSKPSAKATSKGSSFGDALNGAFEQVDKLQADADVNVSDLLQGKEQDVHGAMIAVEKADITFQLMMQVRNKVVNAYQEISRMQF